MFHGDRWDYVFTIKRQGVEPQRRKLTVFFKDDRWTASRATPCPARPSSCHAGQQRKDGKVPRLEATARTKLQRFPKSGPASARPSRRAAGAHRQLSAARSRRRVDLAMSKGTQALKKVAVTGANAAKSPWPAPPGAWATC